MLAEWNTDPCQPRGNPSRLYKNYKDWFVLFNKATSPQFDIRLVHTFKHPGEPRCIAFSADGDRVATGCHRSAQVFCLQTGRELGTYEDENIGFLPDSHRWNKPCVNETICFSPDGQILVTGGCDTIVRLWDIQNRCIESRFEGHSGPILCLQFAPSGYLMSCSGDGVVKLWDVDSKSEVRTITIESGIIFSPIFSPDGKRIAAYVRKGSFGVWNVETGSLMGRHTKNTTIGPHQG